MWNQWSPPITRFLLKRLGLSLITLWLLSVIVFFAAALLPGDVGQTILGPLAPQSAIQALNHKLGTDQPILTQYWNWLSNFVQGDFGTSLLLGDARSSGRHSRRFRTRSSWRSSRS